MIAFSVSFCVKVQTNKIQTIFWVFIVYFLLLFIVYFTKTVDVIVLFWYNGNLSPIWFWWNLHYFWHKLYFPENHGCVRFWTFRRSAYTPPLSSPPLPSPPPAPCARWLCSASLPAPCQSPTTSTLHSPGAEHCTVLHCTSNKHPWIYHCTALHCTTLHCTTLYCTASHYTALYYTVLHYTVLHCT